MSNRDLDENFTQSEIENQLQKYKSLSKYQQLLFKDEIEDYEEELNRIKLTNQYNEEWKQMTVRECENAKIVFPNAKMKNIHEISTIVRSVISDAIFDNLSSICTNSKVYLSFNLVSMILLFLNYIPPFPNGNQFIYEEFTCIERSKIKNKKLGEWKLINNKDANTLVTLTFDHYQNSMTFSIVYELRGTNFQIIKFKPFSHLIYETYNECKQEYFQSIGNNPAIVYLDDNVVWYGRINNGRIGCCDNIPSFVYISEKTKVNVFYTNMLGQLSRSQNRFCHIRNYNVLSNEDICKFQKSVSVCSNYFNEDVTCSFYRKHDKNASFFYNGLRTTEMHFYLRHEIGFTSLEYYRAVQYEQDTLYFEIYKSILVLFYQMNLPNQIVSQSVFETQHLNLIFAKILSFLHPELSLSVILFFVSRYLKRIFAVFIDRPIGKRLRIEHVESVQEPLLKKQKQN